MPQADLTSFHSLTFSVLVLILIFFNIIYYYLTPFWSAYIKSTSKIMFLPALKNLIKSFSLLKLLKTTYKQYSI